MGLAMAVAAPHRLPQLNSVVIPEGVDDAALRSALLDEFDLEIGAGLGALAGKTWRIGLMGYASNERNVVFCLNALETVLSRQGAAVNAGKAVAAARAVFNQSAVKAA
jgi:alanine-glyoxylate transaminase/serine-glyoxylate transaminase/serine-pyruvate transaminase